MNIEESISKIKEVIYMSDGTKVDYIDINHMELGGEVSVDIFIEAIETLLTAYEKEKEKNKELESDIQQKNFEIKCLNSDIKNMYCEEGVMAILEDNFNLSREEAIQILEE